MAFLCPELSEWRPLSSPLEPRNSCLASEGMGRMGGIVSLPELLPWNPACAEVSQRHERRRRKAKMEGPSLAVHRLRSSVKSSAKFAWQKRSDLKPLLDMCGRRNLRVHWPHAATPRNLLRTPRAMFQMQQMPSMTGLQDALSRLADEDSKPNEIDDQVWRLARVTCLSALAPAESREPHGRTQEPMEGDEKTRSWKQTFVFNVSASVCA